MKVREIYDIIDRYAPFNVAMTHDNPGLLVGRGENEVTRVLVTLDADQTAMERAIKEGCELILSHHPFIFEGEAHVSDRTPQGRKLLFALENRLNIISAHTNLDSCEGGINDTLGVFLGLEVTDKFVPTNNGAFLGRIGRHRFASPEAFIENAGKVLGVTPRYVLGEKFERIAWVSGSGTSCMEEAIEAGADALVTGDCKYSAFMNAREAGIGLVDLGHFETEQIIVPVMSKYLRENGLEVIEHLIPSPIKTIGE